MKEGSSNQIIKMLKPAGIREYVAVARPDNWPKNIFMVPGMLFALSIFKTTIDLQLFGRIFIGIASICLVASANYVINEYLDKGYDQYHPLKNKRSAVTTLVNPVIY
jgi:decaprenyl-phosphate phosphoribosyltransferase